MIAPTTSAAAVDDPRDDDDEIASSVRYAITSYGSDMPVDGIVQRLDRGDIFIPPFQRKFVWTLTQASRFIESLIIGLPVPGIFLFKEPSTRKLMVVDGQQRLLSLQRYHRGTFRERAFRLTGVGRELAGKSYQELAEDDRRELDDSIVHATIFQQDHPTNDRSSIYSVFERLNTGGSALQPQEIRACVYRGALSDLLSELATNSHWRHVYHSKNSRRKDEEIILRFLALYYSLGSYKRPMKQFLNEFMERHRDPSQEQCEEFRATFERAIRIVAEELKPSALRPERNLNVSVADAVLVGLAHRLEKRAVIDDVDGLRVAHKELLRQLRDEELYNRWTTDKDRVNRRIELARLKFESVA